MSAKRSHTDQHALTGGTHIPSRSLYLTYNPLFVSCRKSLAGGNIFFGVWHFLCLFDAYQEENNRLIFLGQDVVIMCFQNYCDLFPL